LRGGEDSASERYIFTQLSKITRFIFVEDDDNILDYVNDDGCQVEPIYYAPIIPMVLVNGSKGIGTGFSTDIMNYNPTEIIAYIKSKLQRAESSPSFLPFYKGFRGTIERLPDDRILIKGSFKFVGSEKIKVYELPVGTWTYDFKELLEKLLSSSLIKDYSDMSTDVVVDFTVTFPKDFVMDEEDIRKMLKLNTIRSTTNMHLFDSEERLVKYANVKEIIDAFYEHRYQLYEKRKTYLLAKIFEDLKVARNKMRYLEQVLDGSLDLRNKKRQEIIDMLLAKDFDSRGEDGFNYLIKMPMDMVSEENVEKSLNLQRSLEIEHETLLSKSVEQIWYDELVALEKQL
jgi:DNA topoisomerase-2